MAERPDTRERLAIEFLAALRVKTAELKIPAIRARLIEHYKAAGAQAPGRDAISRYMNPNRDDTKNVRPLTVLFVEACCKAFGLDPSYAERLRQIEARARSPAAARWRARSGLQAECDRLRAENEALKLELDRTRSEAESRRSRIAQKAKSLVALMSDHVESMAQKSIGPDALPLTESAARLYLGRYAKLPVHLKLPLIQAVARDELPSDLRATALFSIVESSASISQELAGPLGELLFKLVTDPASGDFLARLPTDLPDGWSRVLTSCAGALLTSSDVGTAACELIACGRHDMLADLGMEMVSQSGAEQLVEAFCQLPSRTLRETATKALEPVLTVAVAELPAYSRARLQLQGWIADVRRRIPTAFLSVPSAAQIEPPT